MLAGEDGPGGLNFNDYELTYLVGSIALSIILFDGALRTKLRLVPRALAPALVLATAGVMLTAALTGAFVQRTVRCSAGSRPACSAPSSPPPTPRR